MSLSVRGYRMIEPVHEGSKTLIHRALRESDQRSVILKTLRDPSPGMKALSQLKREFDILCNLKHPGVIAAFDLHTQDQGLVMVLEDVGGRGLHRLLGGRGLEFSAFFPLALGVLEGLAYIHQKGIVHQNLSPKNLLFNQQSGVVKLIDFGIASLLRRENGGGEQPFRWEGTPAYMAPEQTGRINRILDYRCDFYAMGVTFFEMLTGRLPFTTLDPHEMIHHHIAVAPPSLHDCNVLIPRPLAEIVAKLLAKNAGDRYQGHHGLRLDLEACRRHILGNQKLPAFFEVGRFDFSERLTVPQKLYGRDPQVTCLHERFEAACEGSVELVLVSGAAGIGKSSLVETLRRPLVEKNGSFVVGKFDQCQRNIPYASLVEAFNLWVREIVAGGREAKARQQLLLQEALGDQAQVIVDVIPELAEILGPCPPVAELSPAEARNRFHLVFQEFVHALPTATHPMVLFLDDLQWADSSSLKLLARLILDGSCAHLTLVGAFRDQEIDVVHPVHHLVTTLDQAGFPYHALHLTNLEPLHINQMLAETLNCSAQRCLPLTEVCTRKTKGNPFFLNRFITDLYERGLIFFDTKACEWLWDMPAIGETDLCENVLDFMLALLQKLPEPTRVALQTAACIGNRFPLNLLSVALEQAAPLTAEHLWPALEAELVVPLDAGYKFYVEQAPLKVVYRFQHDRVQGAAYALIAGEDRAATHLHLARCFQKHLSSEEQASWLFEIADHFNRGRSLLTTDEMRDQLAALNLKAGRRSLQASAYESALAYFEIGIELIGKDGWTRCYPRMLELYQACCEAAFLTTDFVRMGVLADIIHARAETLLDKVSVCALEIDAMVIRNQMREAVDVARPFLTAMGFSLPQRGTRHRLYLDYGRSKWWLMRKPVAYLGDLPPMTDPHQLALMKLIGSLFSATYRAVPSLFPLLVFKVVETTLRYGYAPISTFGFACYGLVLCGAMGQIEKGNQFGSLALSLLERYEARRYQSRTAFVVYGFVRPWQEHVREVLEPLRDAFARVQESGDIEYAAHAAYIRSAYAYFSGAHLPNLLLEMRKYDEAVTKLKQETTAQYHRIFMQAVNNLTVTGKTPWLLSGEFYREENQLAQHVQADDQHAQFCLALNKAMLAFVFHRFDIADQQIDIAAVHRAGVMGFFHESQFYFWRCLIKLGGSQGRDQEGRRPNLPTLNSDLNRLRHWKRFAPMNFRHKVTLIEAERERVLGDKFRAAALFDQAISQAQAADFLQERALAKELCANLYFEMGNEKVARYYLQEAYSDFELWGAHAKMKHIQVIHPSLSMRSFDLVRNTLSYTTGTFTASNGTLDEATEGLDMTAVVLTSQTLSSEIVLRKLLEKIMIIVIEQSGAEKGLLLLEQEGRWLVEGESQIGDHPLTVLQAQPYQDSRLLSPAVVQFVLRTGRHVVLSDACRDHNFGDETYFEMNHTASVLCIPLLNQGHMVGILYLENNLVPGAFTADRVELLQILSSQIAVSLENARRHEEQVAYSRALEQQLEDRSQELKSKGEALAGIQQQLMAQEKMASLGTLSAGIAHEIKNPLSFINNFSEINRELIEELDPQLTALRDHLPEEAREDFDLARFDLKRNTDIIRNHGKRANSIVQSMMLLSKGGTSLPQPTDLNQLVADSIHLAYHGMRAARQRLSVTINKEFSENLPQIETIPQDLGRVFLNLANNAMDAMIQKAQSEAAYRAVLTVKTEDDGDGLTVTVRDNGGGIPEDVRDKIFDAFFSTKPAGSGNSGLGLSISYDVVTKEHGGRLDVTSELGSFTEFVVWLPKERPATLGRPRNKKTPGKPADETAV